MPRAKKLARSRAKTKPCIFNMYGTCKRGEACRFAHTPEELPTELSQAPGESPPSSSVSASAGNLASDLGHDSGSDNALGSEVILGFFDHEAGDAFDVVSVKNTFLTIEHCVPHEGLWRSNSMPALHGGLDAIFEPVANECSETTSVAQPTDFGQCHTDFGRCLNPPEPEAPADADGTDLSDNGEISDLCSQVTLSTDIGQCDTDFEQCLNHPEPKVTRVPLLLAAKLPTDSRQCHPGQRNSGQRPHLEPKVTRGPLVFTVLQPTDSVQWYTGQDDYKEQPPPEPKVASIPTFVASPQPADLGQSNYGQCNSEQWPAPGPQAAHILSSALMQSMAVLSGLLKSAEDDAQASSDPAARRRQCPLQGNASETGAALMPPPPRSTPVALPRAPASGGPAIRAEASFACNAPCSPPAPIRSDWTPPLKTKMCAYNILGKCNRGKACTFAHGEQELATQDLRHTRVCRVWLFTGSCHMAGCTFAHSKKELRGRG